MHSIQRKVSSSTCNSDADESNEACEAMHALVILSGRLVIAERLGQLVPASDALSEGKAS